ncbi:MAG TPA: SGNH/GDSL hydrolase family protein [Dermatophilaceae bacterium]|nr:SGNH/GDSL hydrolase family protein [Dermatophilaceae bacterium]
MGRARRARKIAATAAYGGGIGAAGIGLLTLAGYGVLKAEVLLARRLVGQPFEGAPDDDGLYGAGLGQPVELLVLGDSSAAGMGADAAHQTVGAIIANGVAALSGRPVRLTNVAVVGAESAGLEVQLATALGVVATPDVAVILIGANDVTHRIDKSIAVRHLEQTVRALRATDCEVIVGTCPDLGTIEPVAQPLRLLARLWSRDLAAAQTVAVIEAGGRTVSLGDLLGSEFAKSSHEMFSHDGFHPSPAGYARVAAVLLPSVCDTLGLWTDPADHRPDVRRTGRVDPVAVAAVQAVRDAGTEVSATAVGGQQGGPRGRWAMVLRRNQPAGIAVSPGEEAGDEAHTPNTPPPQ